MASDGRGKHTFLLDPAQLECAHLLELSAVIICVATQMEQGLAADMVCSESVTTFADTGRVRSLLDDSSIHGTTSHPRSSV